MRSDYWGEGAHSTLPVVGDFFHQVVASRLIDGGAEFPFARPTESIWEPFIDAAKDWFGGIFEGLFGKSAPAPPRYEPQPERGESDRPFTKESLQEMLKQKQEQRQQEYRGLD
jgi:penicillin-binding protein 1A